MKSNLKWFITGSVITLVMLSCGKRIVPVSVTEREAAGYDTVLYNVALVEGSRNKMNGNAGEAINYYQRALEINPESGVAPYEIASMLFIRGDAQGALQFGRKAVNNDPQNIWYLNNLANIYFSAGVPDSAIVILERIVELYPEEEETMFNLAGFYIANGDADKGEVILKRFRSKYGDDEKIVYNLLNALNEQGKREETEELLEEMCLKFPDNTAYKGMLAELYRETGRSEEAVGIYNSLFASDPDNPVLLLSYMDYLFEEKRYDELTDRMNVFLINDSIEVEDKIALLAGFASDSSFIATKEQSLIMSAMVLEANHPENREVMLALASLYGIAGDTEKEISKLSEVARLFPRDYPTREQLLLKLNESGRNEELYQYAGRVSAEFNMYPLPKLLLAYSANELGKYREALDELKKIRILINENPDFMMQILVLEADIYYKMENYEDSWESYEKALVLDPEDALVLNNYAYFLAEQNQELPRAASMVRKAIGIDRSVTYLDTWAWVLYKQGKNRRAMKVMETILETGTDDSEILEHYGFILFKAGKCDDAVNYWEKALVQEPGKTYLLKEIEKCGK
ncbi:MAG: tetratricopeptide repeat protein [Bacteroidales bacterium]|nr:tetratricopeptide repeat protein [Bacteroidales bacterium]